MPTPRLYGGGVTVTARRPLAGAAGAVLATHVVEGSGEHVLDNAGWHSLVGPHARFAVGEGLARAYRPDVSVFHAAADDLPEAWEALRPLAMPDGVVVLFRGDPITVPAG